MAPTGVLGSGGTRKMRRRLVAAAVVAGVALTAAVVQLAPEGATATPLGPPDPAPEIADSRSLSGSPTLSGRVLAADGTPLAKAWIVVVAWPSQEALEAIPDGAQV